MSNNGAERGEIEVLVPIARPPTRDEVKGLLHLAWGSAHELVTKVGGRVIGVKSVARAQALDGSEAMRVMFEVEAPESTWHHRNTHAVGTIGVSNA